MRGLHFLACGIVAALVVGADLRSEPSSAQQPRTAPGYASLYGFKGGTDGASPTGPMIAMNGNLYGTTVAGGAHCGCGTVFEVSPSGQERVVYRFQGRRDGATPEAGVIAVNGMLYGTTMHGGSNDNGTVFEVSPSGQERVLHRFRGKGDGRWPQADLINVNGTLYGTTIRGGDEDHGTVFEVSRSGRERVLYDFDYQKTGFPVGALAVVNGKLYGITNYVCDRGSVCGTIFELSVSGRTRVLHTFNGWNNDDNPSGVIAVNGKLYGIIADNAGAVFEMSTSGVERMVYRFSGAQNGRQPSGGLVALNGKLYGTTTKFDPVWGDCPTNCGTIFEVSLSGRERVLHRFKGGTDGARPVGLIAIDGKLYGTTQGRAGLVDEDGPAQDTGGQDYNGTVFEASP